MASENSERNGSARLPLDADNSPVFEGGDLPSGVPGLHAGDSPAKSKRRGAGGRRDTDSSVAGAAELPGFDPVKMAERLADRSRKDAPEDPEAGERWPGIHFLLSLHKGLDGEFAEAAGFSVYCKGGMYHWSLKAPGVNTALSGKSSSLTTLFDDMERSYRVGEAEERVLKKEREGKFQERRKKA